MIEIGNKKLFEQLYLGVDHKLNENKAVQFLHLMIHFSHNSDQNRFRADIRVVDQSSRTAPHVTKQRRPFVLRVILLPVHDK